MFKNGETASGAGLWLPAVTLLVFIGLVACQGNRSSDDTLTRLRAVLPDSVSGWIGEDADAIYDSDSIFSYIDGHAEVYLAYGMRRCLARRYSGPAGEAGIAVDVFELSTPADAFGVFTHDLDGDPVQIGTDGLIRYGWLSFWKGSFFVSVYAEEDTEASRGAVLQLGSIVADAIPGGGERPTIVEALPSNGLDRSSVRYLHNHQILNSHVWVGEDDVFHLTADVAAALGRYRRGDASAFLLVVEYPDIRQLETARADFVTAFFGDSAATEPVQYEDHQWSAIAHEGRRLVAVLAADSPDLAQALLEDTLEENEHGQ